MNKRQHSILVIPQDALEETIAACQVEVKDMQMKIPSKTELLLRFIIMELQTYLRFSLAGLALSILGGLLYPKASYIFVIGYILLLGSAMVFEVYRRQHYQTGELFAPVYLNPGRVFLFKMSGIALLEIVEVMIICTILSVYAQLEISYTLIFGCLPLFLLQLQLVLFVGQVRHLYMGLSLYLLLFIIYGLVAWQSELFQNASVVQLMLLIAVLIIIYFIQLIYMYYRQKRRNVVWN